MQLLHLIFTIKDLSEGHSSKFLKININLIERLKK